MQYKPLTVVAFVEHFNHSCYAKGHFTPLSHPTPFLPQRGKRGETIYLYLFGGEATEKVQIVPVTRPPRAGLGVGEHCVRNTS